MDIDCSKDIISKHISKQPFTRSISSPELSKKFSSLINSASVIAHSAFADDMSTSNHSTRKSSTDEEEISRLVRQDTSPVNNDDCVAVTSRPSVNDVTARRSLSRLRNGSDVSRVSRSGSKSVSFISSISDVSVISRIDTNNNTDGHEAMDTTPPLNVSSNPESNGVHINNAMSGHDRTTPCSAPGYVEPGPGAPIEIAFSFDTTGSMSQCLDEVRARVQETITRLFSDIPNLRIAIFAHGDYCDADMYGYVTKFVDFTTDQSALCEFVRDVSGTGGGDFEECYELVLKQACDSLSWTTGTHRSLVMIGDAIPHPVSEEQPIDWREQVNRIHKEKGVRVYGVQCLAERGAAEFFSELAEQTGGRHIRLDHFSTIIDIIMAICYREHRPEDFEAYEREVRLREGRCIRRELSDVFDALRDPNAPSQEDMDHTTATSGEKKAESQKQKIRTSNKPSIDKRNNNGTSTCKGKKGARKNTTAKPRTVRAAPKKTRTARNATPGKTDKTRNNTKPKTNKVTLKKREFIHGTQFLFKDKKWTRWEKIMGYSVKKEETKLWTRTEDNNEQTCFRKNHIFNKKTETPALYEFGIQYGRKQKIRPCYVKATRGFASRYAGFWQSYLFRSDHVKDEVSRCNRFDISVYVRRCAMTSPTSSAALLRKTYDYPWNRPHERHLFEMTIIKNGVTVYED